MEANATPELDIVIVGVDRVIDLDAAPSDASAATGGLDITAPISLLGGSIGGERPIIQMTGNSRIFDVHDTAGFVNFVSLQLTGGSANQSGESSGGAISSEIGDQEVMIANSLIYGNQANSGAGVYNDAVMTIVDTEIYLNELVDEILATQFIRGSGVRNRGSLTIENSTIHSNDGQFSPPAVGSFAVYSTPINDNFDAPSLTLENVTVSENLGGGVIGDDGLLRIVNSTVYANTGIGVRFSPTPGIDDELTLSRTVIASNGIDDCGLNGAAADWNIANSADSDDSCELPAANSLLAINPMLGPLQDNGGATRTHAPDFDSPLVEGGSQGTFAGSGCGTSEDQRGIDRPQDGNDDGSVACDIGAVELSIEFDDLLFADGFDD